MQKHVPPTITITLINDEYLMEVNVDLRPYDRIIWHQEEAGDGTLAKQVWIAEGYKTGDAEGETSLTACMSGDEKSRVVKQWKALRANIPYYETKEDHVAQRQELYAVEDEDPDVVDY